MKAVLYHPKFLKKEYAKMGREQKKLDTKIQIILDDGPLPKSPRYDGLTGEVKKVKIHSSDSPWRVAFVWDGEDVILLAAMKRDVPDCDRKLLALAKKRLEELSDED